MGCRNVSPIYASSDIKLLNWKDILDDDAFRQADNDANGYLDTTEMLTLSSEQLKDGLSGVVNQFKDIEGVAETTANTIEKISFKTMYEGLDKAISAITAAEQDMTESNYLSASSVKALQEAGLDDYLEQTEQGYRLTNDALEIYLTNQGKAYKSALNDALKQAKDFAKAQGSVNDELNKSPEAMIKYIQSLKEKAMKKK